MTFSLINHRLLPLDTGFPTILSGTLGFLRGASVFERKPKQNVHKKTSKSGEALVGVGEAWGPTVPLCISPKSMARSHGTGWSLRSLLSSSMGLLSRLGREVQGQCCGLERCPQPVQEWGQKLLGPLWHAHEEDISHGTRCPE